MPTRIYQRKQIQPPDCKGHGDKGTCDLSEVEQAFRFISWKLFASQSSLHALGELSGQEGSRQNENRERYHSCKIPSNRRWLIDKDIDVHAEHALAWHQLAVTNNHGLPYTHGNSNERQKDERDPRYSAQISAFLLCGIGAPLSSLSVAHVNQVVHLCQIFNNDRLLGGGVLYQISDTLPPRPKILDQMRSQHRFS